MTTIRPKCCGRELHVVGDRDHRPAGGAAGSTIAPIRATPGPSWPVVGSSSTRTAGSIASTLASATSLRRTGRGRTGWWRGPRQAARRDRGARRARDRPPREPQVARPEADLALDAPLEQLVVRVLEDEADRPRESVDRLAGDVRGRRRRTRPRSGRSSPLRCFTSVVLPEPFWPTIATRLAGRDRQVDAAQRLDAARVAVDEAADVDRHRLGRSRTARPSEARVCSTAPASEPRRPRSPRAQPPRPPRRTPRAPDRRPAASASRTSVGGPSPSGPSTARPARRPADRSRPSGPRSSTRHRSPRRGRPDRARRTRTSRRPAPARRSSVGDRVGCRRVELRRRLVERRRACPCDDAGDRDALLLAARQRERLAVGEVRDAKPLEHRVDAARPSPRAARPGSRARTPAPRAPSASRPTAGSPASRRRCRPDRRGRSRSPSSPSMSPTVARAVDRAPGRPAG